MRSLALNATLTALLLTLGLTPGCAGSDPADAAPASGVAIAVLPLDLPGVTDVTYTLSVTNDDGEPVWARQITSTAYGDGSGAVSYVGPCDASSNPNTVGVVIDAITAGATTLVAGTDYLNPAPATAPLTREVTCVADTDAPVSFDISVMRAAKQGFFDFAVSFNDIFCSAKLDCERTPGQDLELLFDPNTGKRDRTVILGLACTAGLGTETWLHLSDLVIRCVNGAVTREFVIDAAGGPGNLDPPYGAAPNTTDLVFQAATYRGRELLEQNGTSYQKSYWNVAVGLNEAALPTLGACRLTTQATATDGELTGGELPIDSYSPYLTWDVALTDASGARICTSHGMDDATGVTPVYTTAGNVIAFGASFRATTGEVTDHEPLIAQSRAGGDVEPLDLFGAPLWFGDFDADLLADLAVGAPGEDGGAGAVSLFRGLRTGPAPSGTTFTAATLGGLPAPNAKFGAALASGDFNHDGFTDLAIGAPGDTAAAGALWVVPGSATGLVPASATRFTRATLGCGAATAGDELGFALASGDFDNNTFTDLAIGLPGADSQRGRVCVVTGSASGLAATKVFDRPRGYLTGAAPAVGDRYGAALAAGKLNADAFADLAVGAPGTGASAAGAVEVLFGQSGAAYFGTAAALSQANAAGLNELGDGFGAALAVSDLDGDGTGDLFVGAPTDKVGAAAVGGVYAFFGPVAPLNAKNASLDAARYAQEVAHPAGSRFGAALATPDVDNDGYSDLVIGEPGANGGVGRYTLVRGSATGPGAGPSVDAAALGVRGNGQDALGASVAAGDVNGDGFDDFALGAPGSSPTSRPAGGQVIYVAGRGTTLCDAGGCGGACGDCALTSHACLNGACDFNYLRVNKSSIPHVVDGRFTHWVAPPDTPAYYEWSDVPHLAGDFTDVRLDYDGTSLHLINDWHVNDSLPLEPGCYNLFVVYTEGGAKQWQIKLFADGIPQVFLNAEPVDPTTLGVLGEYTFSASPLHADDHTIFELALPTGPGGFGAVFKDPGPTQACDELLTEPTTFVGRLLTGGGLDVARNTDVPWVFGANGSSLPGATVALTGVGLGSAGTATLGGRTATTLGWGDDTVYLTVPTGADSSGVRLDTADGATNALLFSPAPTAAVLNRKSAFTHVVDGAMTGWSLGVPAHEWRDIVPVPAGGTAQVYADYDGTALSLLFDWLDPSHPLTAVHLRGWTGGGSGVIGGPQHLNGLNDPSGLVQWDITVEGGVVTVLRDGVVVSDLAAAGIIVALGGGGSLYDPAHHAGFEVRLPTGPLGFGFELTGGGSLSDPTTLVTASHIVTGVADPKSGLYVRASDDPTLLTLTPRTVAIGATVTLSGVNLGTGVGGQVSLGGGVNGTVTSWTPQQIVLTVPPLADTGLARVLYDDGRKSNGVTLRVSCATGTDCASGVCNVDGSCDPVSCTDNLKNGTESAIDCGGSCDPCASGATCNAATDCASLVCAGTPTVCVAATCSDGVKNQGESDIDCGGANCARCVAPKRCDVDNDCQSLVCTLGVCQAPTCFDDVKNQTETDVDCGGLCGDCVVGQQCSVAADCAFGTCTGGVCTCTPACSGKVCGANGCGGSCGTCPGVQTCQTNGTVCDFEYTIVPKSSYAHTVDGVFTGWNVTTLPTTFEWYDIPPARGAYTNAYFDYKDAKLYIMNDWHYNDAGTIDPGCYNLFLAYTGGGTETWQAKVFANGTTQVFKNGALQPVGTAGIAGAYGYSFSPRVQDREHTLYELSFPAAPGRFAMQLHDPGPSSGCPTLVREPVSFVGDATLGGGLKIAEDPNVAWIPGVNPTKGTTGTLVNVYGVALGTTPGTIKFGTVTATPERWTDTSVWVRVPDALAAGAHNIQITVSEGGHKTNTFPFTVTAFASEPGAILNTPSSYPHTIDGQFTDWTGVPGVRHEWDDIVPAKGQYTYAYFDYDGQFLYLMNDWYANPTAAMSAECYNQFFAYTGGGLEQWDVKVYGNGTVTAAKNGVLVDLGAEGVQGATTFGPSPLTGANHTMFELKLPASPGGWGLQLHDPGPGNPGSPGFTCADNQYVEPRNFKGVLDPKGGQYVVPSTTATIYALSPMKAAPGQSITIRGAALGATRGTGYVTFPPAVNVTTGVTSWSDTQIVVTVPAGVETGLLKVQTNPTGTNQTTNTLLYRRICNTGADCTSGVCFNEECQLPTCTDGVKNSTETAVDCGGPTCGDCPNGATCSVASDCVSGVCASGTCQAPQCNDTVKNGTETDINCGGGACPACAYEKTCFVGSDCQSGWCASGLCRPTASGVATTVPTPPSSFQQDVQVKVRVADTGGAGITQARVAAPLGWLLPAVGPTGVTAKLADGTTVALTMGTAGGGPSGGTWYTTPTGLSVVQGGANPYIDFIFNGAQAQENTGNVRWYTDVVEGYGFGRVAPNPNFDVIGAIADGGGSGVVTPSPNPLPAGTYPSNITVTLLNTLTEYVNTTAAAIFSNWTVYGDPNALWALYTHATHGQVLRTTVNTAIPSYFISDDLLYDGSIQLDIGVLGDTTNDDDFIGLIFRWQDANNFYLLDWKQEVTATTGLKGLVLRRIRNGDWDGNGVTNANDTTGDLWDRQTSRTDLLGTRWATAWTDNVMYKLKVVLDGPNIKVYIDDVLRLDVVDYTFAGGRYGPYTFSQGFTCIKNLAVYRDTITTETVEVEVPAGWPNPVVGLAPAGNLTAMHKTANVTPLLSVGPVGAGPHGGTVLTASPLTVLPGESLVLSFGPVTAPPVAHTETWYMRTAGVGGVLTTIGIQPTLNILPAP